MSFLCLLVFSICVLHNSLLTLDVFFTEHGCNHWVGWGECFALQIQHECYLSRSSFCFLLSFLITGLMIATRAWLWCDLFRVSRIILTLHVFLVYGGIIYDKIQCSVIGIGSSKLCMHQSKADWQQKGITLWKASRWLASLEDASHFKVSHKTASCWKALSEKASWRKTSRKKASSEKASGRNAPLQKFHGIQDLLLLLVSCKIKAFSKCF